MPGKGGWISERAGPCFLVERYEQTVGRYKYIYIFFYIYILQSQLAEVMPTCEEREAAPALFHFFAATISFPRCFPLTLGDNIGEIYC